MWIMANYRCKRIIDILGLIYMQIGVNQTKKSRNVDVAESSMYDVHRTLYVAVEVSECYSIYICIYYIYNNFQRKDSYL